MGHQESPPPRQRHRVPHHRRRHHHHEHHSASRTANGKSALSLGRLNREYHAPDGHNVVESWLGQLTAPDPTSWLVSPEAQNQPIHRGKGQRSQDRHIFPCSQNPRRVDPLWRPQHIPLAQGSSPPRFPVLTNRDTKLKRHKQNSGDSSLISDPSPYRALRELNYKEPNSKHDEGSHHKPPGEAEVGTVGASSPTSHKAISPAFGKRPRHKTKADKYDTKKSDDRKRKAEDERRPRRSKWNKRRPIVTGKNVMKNFTSEAVLNDRITANLKPGLFNNKRVPKEHLITDLSFSEMPFPTHQERDVPQQKGLSSSRLRERRRESRELEQISSFFLPARADATLHKERQAKLKCDKEADNERSYYRNNATSGYYQDSFVTPSSPASLKNYRQQSFMSCENPHLIPTVTPNNLDCRPSSSGTTTYFTWPSSQDSPQARQYLDNTRLRSMEPARSPTPENIQKALVATGVYKDTGIYSCDVSTNQQNRASKIRGESSSTRSSIVHHVKTCEREDSRTKRRCSNSTEATAALLAHLEARWNTILPSEWRPLRSLEAEISLADQQRVNMAPGITVTNSNTPSRQGIVKQVRIKPIQDVHTDQNACCRSDHHSGASPHSTAKSPMPVPPVVDQIINHATIADEVRATISSRDAMPPPPIPSPRLDSFHFSSVKPGDDSNSSIRLGSATPVGTHGQVPNYEHAQVMDVNSATGQPRESSREPEKVIPTLDSASWIPQAVTSGITSYERHKTLSRLSMRSPIYEIHGKDKDPQEILAPTRPPPTHMAESMADFIMRIESELEESTSIDGFCQPEPIMESWEYSLEAMGSNNEAQNPQLTAPDGPQIDRRQLATGILDLGPQEVVETDRRFHEHEELAAPVKDRSTTTFTECARDDDEFLEMSNFWRPNRFSYF
ncbi:hypothetical protein CHU98_g8294 [Xylaria longipes]|nr:hypothetical protein CHU98_g8294 [Xylaria longipes]